MSTSGRTRPSALALTVSVPAWVTWISVSSHGQPVGSHICMWGGSATSVPSALRGPSVHVNALPSVVNEVLRAGAAIAGAARAAEAIAVAKARRRRVLVLMAAPTHHIPE